MDEEIAEIADIIDSILENSLPYKVSSRLSEVSKMLKLGDNSNDTLIKIQDELEELGAVSNIDDYTRNEIINLVTYIESLYNS